MMAISNLIKLSKKYNPRPGQWPDYIVKDGRLYMWLITDAYRGRQEHCELPDYSAGGGWYYRMVLGRRINSQKISLP